MQRINSLTDIRGEDFRTNVRHNCQLAADLKERQQAARFVRPERDLERLRRQNKMFVRDRIEALLDPGTPFLELSTLAGNKAYDGEVPGAGQVVGIGIAALVKPPLFIQTVFGILGGIGPHPEDVMHMKRTADRLFGDQYQWSILGAGRSQMPLATMAAALGGHVRVGLEDSLWLGRGQLAESNAQQVTNIRRVIEGLGLEIASPDEARQILDLKGGDRVAF